LCSLVDTIETDDADASDVDAETEGIDRINESSRIRSLVPETFEILNWRFDGKIEICECPWYVNVFG
jgi:hypothetical protein